MPFTKTALNKTKKVDLIQMFLDQQAELNDIKMDGIINKAPKDTMAQVIKDKNSVIEKLKEENDEWKEVAGVYWLETPSQLETWMSASIHEDDEVYSKYMEPLELRDEVEKLKGDIVYIQRQKKIQIDQSREFARQINDLNAKNKKLKEENKKHKDTIVSLKSSVDDLREARDMRDQQIKELKQQVDYAYKQLNELMSKVTLLKDELESNEESDSDSESEEEEDECVCCGTNFDQHEARYNKGEDLRLKYQKYFGSENDDGDICPECLDKIY